MKDMLYLIVEYIARIHDKINTLNDHTKGSPTRNFTSS